MRTKMMIFAITAVSAVSPSMASAAKTCVEVYQQCLNDTYNTSGITRYLADIECAARYAGCLRQVLV